MNNPKRKTYLREKKAIKSLGQHFLTNMQTANDIVASLKHHKKYNIVLEIGPGKGCLTSLLFQKKEFKSYVIEIDTDLVKFLRQLFPNQLKQIIEGDFLKLDLMKTFKEPLAIIGNFPYNISSQILFKILDNRNHIVEMAGTFQLEVAQRIVSPPGVKNYGILSVLIQAFYDVSYLFEIEAASFSPKPNVKSAVIHLKRNNTLKLPCDEQLFFKIVKAAFHKRRKMLRNCLVEFIKNKELTAGSIFSQRAEQLTISQYITVTNMISEQKNK